LALAGLFVDAVFFAVVRHLGSGLALAAEPRSLVLRTRQRLLERPQLAPAKGGTEGEMQRGGHTLRFHVDQRARTLVQIDVGAKGAKDFTKTPLEICVPTVIDGYVVMWVDAEQPFEHLAWPIDLADAVERKGLWGQLADQHALVWSGEHLKLEGLIGDRVVEISLEDGAVCVSVQVSPSLYAERGTGQSGDPVLDMLVDSHGIPGPARELVLGLVHGHHAEISGGWLQLRHQGSLPEVWPEIEALLAVVGV
jgi:hypothetical protein